MVTARQIQQLTRQRLEGTVPSYPEQWLEGPMVRRERRIMNRGGIQEPKLSGEGSPLTLHCAPASSFLAPRIWYVGVRGVFWPYADFRPFKF